MATYLDAGKFLGALITRREAEAQEEDDQIAIAEGKVWREKLIAADGSLTEEGFEVFYRYLVNNIALETESPSPEKSIIQKVMLLTNPLLQDCVLSIRDAITTTPATAQAN